ncbi:cyclopropane fatty acyl phospholipid synthase [archaeon]|nr:cyclopropane fatty acyl phospholipid synthase [archaeon]MBT7128500.1 cyclopropane fatty acyl phospholipid synthase [archaeon]
MNAESVVRDIAGLAGVEVGGNEPWDIRVSDNRFYDRVLNEGSLGLGETYMDGSWDCDRVDMFFDRVLGANLEKRISGKDVVIARVKSKLFNRQRKSKAFEIGERHYDIGNDLYREMLDDRMVYTCGYWKNAFNLDGAQEAKLDLSCRKLGLEAGMRVLDVGCGFGSFAKYAAEKYGVDVVGVTVSKEQVKLGREMCEGLPVELRLQDYRDVKGKFDRVVSLGMFEHVGPKNYDVYFDKVRDCLADDGLFLLQTIGCNGSGRGSERWIDKYIFPGGVLPSVKQIGTAAEGRLVMRDWHEFGKDYDKTLMAWNGNFQAGWEGLSGKYNERFKRMWEYYLLSCAGSFRAGRNQLWQVMFSKEGGQGNFVSVR